LRRELINESVHDVSPNLRAWVALTIVAQLLGSRSDKPLFFKCGIAKTRRFLQTVLIGACYCATATFVPNVAATHELSSGEGMANHRHHNY
jgi:hypothetical protein